MSDSPAPLSVTERAALADLLVELGPDAPTCCAGWTTADLAAHLVIRDRRPDTAPGAVLGGPLGRWTDRVLARTRDRTPWPHLVDQLRAGPPVFVPTAWGPVDRLVNGAEMTIHHEDVRRAQADWAPRELPRAAQDFLWDQVDFLARTRPRSDRGLQVRRTDTGATQVLREGSPVTTVAGEPLEVLLWVSGREDAARVEVS
ncbi:TIGR03085 family metal-binding protein [Klenkia marina]|uniref:TIGR03085 family metal-binding protein n=1 Tax=Klenkia marina TaxID=1960309 RepID=UPI001FB3BAC6|nr:TIGR03085 family metal-binding protein [Klenkia marina]